MIDINEMLEKIEQASFFSKMGSTDSDVQNEGVILIENVEKVFVNPLEVEFKGLYKQIEWLPTSLNQDDPFYKKQDYSKELAEIRVKINKSVMNATENLPKDKLIFTPYDFCQTARGGICFAFRQYIIEQHLNLGNRWQMIVNIYYAGHWPVGFTKEKLIVI